jgi:steroid delta-isomerase-like uncharacterized protein
MNAAGDRVGAGKEIAQVVQVSRERLGTPRSSLCPIARLALASFLLVAGCGSTAPTPKAPEGPIEVGPQDVQRWLDAWNSHDLGRITDLFTPDAIIHQPQNPQPMTATSQGPFFKGVFEAFPDIHFESAGMTLARGEAASWERVTGTMIGPMTDAASGKKVQPTGRRFSLLTVKRLEYAPDHRIREFWSIWDRAALLEQLGLPQAPSPEATGEAATVQEAPITHSDVDRWAAAWNSHDIETVAALFTTDVTIDQPENEKPLDAKSLRGFFGMIFKAYPDFHVVVSQAVVEGHTAVSIERVTGTWSGPFVSPATGQVVPGNGRRFDHPGVMVIDYAPDHRIRHVSIIWDQLIVDRQLGIKAK